ncbi:poly-beta-1,6-N-acetyl-D-glucosamine N-deacetylase, partial [Pseudomonas sp. MWU12-2534b]
PCLEVLEDQAPAGPGALQRTVFGLPARDWNHQPAQDLAGQQVADWMGRHKRQGATHFGYYPDNFRESSPDLKALRPARSNKWSP